MSEHGGKLASLNRSEDSEKIVNGRGNKMGQVAMRSSNAPTGKVKKMKVSNLNKE